MLARMSSLSKTMGQATPSCVACSVAVVQRSPSPPRQATPSPMAMSLHHLRSQSYLRHASSPNLRTRQWRCHLWVRSHLRWGQRRRLLQISMPSVHASVRWCRRYTTTMRISRSVAMANPMTSRYKQFRRFQRGHLLSRDTKSPSQINGRGWTT